VSSVGTAGRPPYRLLCCPAPENPWRRRTPAAVYRLLAANFPHTRFLSGSRAADLLAARTGHGLAGGAIYDAFDVTVESL